MSKHVTWCVVGLLICCGGVACRPSTGGGGGSAAANVDLLGAGATFPEPLYKTWFDAYNQANPHIRVRYEGGGSSMGINYILDRKVDFGASDAAMEPEKIAQIEEGVQLIPLTAGSVVLAYNLQGVTELKLSRDAYVGIFLGKITRWNDPAIAATNPDLTLPDAQINAVVRADGSGTSFVFTNHLCAVSDEFLQAIGGGATKQPVFPISTAIAAKGNDGVTSTIQSTPGSIGYIEYGYAKNNGLAMATLENKAGRYVPADTDSGRAALASVEMPDDLIVWPADPEDANAYPIVTYTWVICYKHYASAAKADALRGVLAYALTDGQALSERLGYIPLPPSVVEKCLAALDNIQGTAGDAPAAP